MRVRVDGAEIRRRRQELPGAPSLRSIAGQARLAAASLSRIENGLHGANVRTVNRLASVLRCPPDSLLDHRKAPRPDRERIDALERRVAALEALLGARGRA